MKKLLMTLCLAGAMCQTVVAQIETAQVTGGKVQGVVTDGLSIFKGIPFAAPPVGERRWQAPTPTPAWSGVKQADAFAPACMQPENSMGNTAPVAEDCLYLNVWTPAARADAKLPVLVWIYGGGFSGGSTSIPMYDGAGFAQQGVVFVSVAYRLGPFGFLAHPELSRESGHGSGAYGLADMIAGLAWVRDNIARFGGDPGQVTIFGHSAGGMAVSALAASPVAKGLFQRAICMSGGSFAPLQTSNQQVTGLGIPSLPVAEENGAAFFRKLGVADLKAARALSAGEIQQGASGGGPDAIRFRPVADGHIITSDLYSLYEAGRFNDTPVLVGNTSDEGAAFPGGEVTPESFTQQIKAQYGPHADSILAAYPHATAAEAAIAARGIRRESSFAWNTWTWARLQSRHGQGKVYQYFYDYHPGAPEGTGSGHGSDVPYAFQTLASRREPAPEDVKLSSLISAYWVNFAKTGDPNGSGLPAWPAFTEQDQKAMVFDAAPGARPVPNLDKLKAYDAYIDWLRGQAK